MSRSKFTKEYPEQYLDLLDALEEHPDKEIEVEAPTMAEAQNFRLNFHSFKGAALREGLEKLYPAVGKVHVYVRDNPPRAILVHKSHTVQAKMVDAALAKLKNVS